MVVQINLDPRKRVSVLDGGRLLIDCIVDATDTLDAVVSCFTILSLFMEIPCKLGNRAGFLTVVVLAVEAAEEAIVGILHKLVQVVVDKAMPSIVNTTVSQNIPYVDILKDQLAQKTNDVQTLASSRPPSVASNNPTKPTTKLAPVLITPLTGSRLL
ncbi:hypothetical protein BC830DRAFT_1164945 [Chytriomyces sp. MP71]|nr:hypothetical protein BC830DRAFT_1164945 [Chytriomyces sp. MP71]